MGGRAIRIGEVFCSTLQETICIQLSYASFITSDLDCTGAAHQKYCKVFVNLTNLNIWWEMPVAFLNSSSSLSEMQPLLPKMFYPCQPLAEGNRYKLDRTVLNT